MSYQIQVIEMTKQNISDYSVENFVTKILCNMVCDYLDCRRIRNFVVDFQYEEGQEVIPFDDLTEQQVLDWIVSQYGEENIDSIYNALKSECEQIANENPSDPTVPQTVQAPWVNAYGE